MLNRLAIVELDERGWVLEREQLVRTILPLARSRHRTFAPALPSRYTITNNSSQPRFFLFAASHRIDAASTDEVWHQSDFEIRFDNDSMLVIGWTTRFSAIVLNQRCGAGPR